MSRRALYIIAALAAVVWFAGLGYRDLIEPDEGRYSEIPREMIDTGDWLTPRVNGFKYFEKPPLQYWATAVTFSLAGQSNATARLWVAFIGFLGALWAGFVAHRLYGSTAGFFGFIFTLSALLYVAMGHTITLDMTFTAFLALAIGSLVLAQSRREDHGHVRRWMLVAWAGLALATLTKGLAALVLPAGAVVAYSVWQRDLALWKHLHLGKGLLLYTVLTAPWFVAVSLENPEFPYFFFVREHFERYTSTTHRREQPVWYFTAIFVLGVFPWTVVTLKSLIKPAFSWRGPADDYGFNAERFMWVFIMVVLVFFSLGQSKMYAYILPVFPVVAILVGRRLAANGLGRLDALAIVLLAVALAIAAWRAPQFGSDQWTSAMALNYRPFIVVASLSFFAAAFFALRAGYGRRTFVAVAGLLALLGTQSLSWGYHSQSPARSGYRLAEAIRPYVTDEGPIFGVRCYPQSLPFYLGRTMTLVAYEGELKMGIEQEPHKWIATEDEFARRWLEADRAVAIIRRDYFDQFVERDLPMQIIYEGKYRKAVAKP